MQCGSHVCLSAYDSMVTYNLQSIHKVIVVACNFICCIDIGIFYLYMYVI